MLPVRLASASPISQRFIGKRNPHVECRTVSDRIEIDNAEAILSDHDLIIDGTDNFATRLLVNDAAVRLEFQLISAAAQQFQGQVAMFRGKPCYRRFVGDVFDADDCDTCAELGAWRPHRDRWQLCRVARHPCRLESRPTLRARSTCSMD